MVERPILFSGPMVRALLAGTKTQTRRICTKARDVAGGWAASVHPDGSGLGWIAWYPKPVSAEETRRLYPGEQGFRCPYGVLGHRLWVRETWASVEEDLVAYRADGKTGAWMGNGEGGRMFIHHGWIRGVADREKRGHWVGLGKYGDRWRPSIFMPRWASRITLEVTKVRVQRLQDISEEDAVAEGVLCEDLPSDTDNFHPPGSYGYVTGFDPLPNGRIYPTAREAYGDGWDHINGERAPWRSNPWVWVVTFKRVSA